MWVTPKVKSKGRCKLPCVGRYEIYVSQGTSKENAAVHSYGTTTPPREIQTDFNPVSQLFTDGNSCDLDQDGASSVWTARGWTLSGSSRAFGNKQGGVKGRCCPGQRIEEAQQPSSSLLCTRLFISTVPLYKLSCHSTHLISSIYRVFARNSPRLSSLSSDSNKAIFNSYIITYQPYFYTN